MSLLLLRTYKTFLSPLLGVLFFPYGQCRYYPSCSNYAAESVKKYGIAKGVWMTLSRLIRCNPWAAGGADLVS